MNNHKYDIGSRVGLIPGPARTAEGEYEIVRHLPADGDDFQYRIKSVREPNERLVKEYQLYAWQQPATA